MKRVAILIPVLLVACSSPTPPQNQPAYKQQDLIVDRHVQPMSRNEVISAVHDCEGNGLRASMVYAKRQVNGYSVDIVIDVVCAPKFKYFN